MSPKNVLLPKILKETVLFLIVFVSIWIFSTPSQGMVSAQGIDAVSEPDAERVTIISISATGGKGSNGNPQTGSVVTLSAKLSIPHAYNLTSCSWTGNITPGQGNVSDNCRYNYVPKIGPGPSSATYGNKKVTLTVTFGGTGGSGSTSKTASFKVLFNKTGDDANTCAWWNLWSDCIRNWYFYWNDDGAVTQLNRTDLGFDTSLGKDSYGYFSVEEDKLYIGRAAAEVHYDDGLNIPASASCPGGDFGGAQGIDTLAEVIEHEARHKWVNHNWDPLGVWHGLLDSDRGIPTDDHKDLLPDIFEITETFTDIGMVDSCNLEEHKASSYRYYGDHEFYVINYAYGKRGEPKNDWANPGKQSIAPSLASARTSQATANIQSGPAYANAFFRSQTSDWPSEMGSLTGVYSSAGVDENSNGLFDTLKVTAGVHINAPELYSVVAWLSNSSGTQIAVASNQQNLSVGDHQIELPFLGKVIRYAGHNGPYKLLRIELRVGDSEYLVQGVDDAYTTAAYTASQFENAEARFSGSLTDQGVDSNGDGQLDLLRLNVGVTVNLPGTYNLIGELEAGGEFVYAANQELNLSAGNHTVSLDFQGANIYYSHQDGPYQVVALRILDENWEHMDFLDTTYNTAAYPFAQFVHSGSSIATSGLSDAAISNDSDPEYEKLRVYFTVNAASSGSYNLLADLEDASGEQINTTLRVVSLSAGSNSTYVDFSGDAIYSHGVNGPYTVTRLSLVTPSGELADVLSPAHVTQAYACTSFSKPILTLNGSYSDTPLDNDSDGKYDQLKVTVGIDSLNNGEVTGEAELVDANGRVIQKASGVVSVSANTPASINLLYDGFYINANGLDGPYYLRNLLVYYSQNPNISDAEEYPYQTAAYSFGEFVAGAGKLFLPVVLRD